jgi:dihydroflavonol-4-reductase
VSKKALVTGVSGFVGSNLARLLLERGYEVRALMRKQSHPGNLPKHQALESMEGDLQDANSLKRAAKGCDEVFHVAADYRFWAKYPRELYLNNVTGTENLLRASGEAGVSRIVYTSTVGAIGLADEPKPCNEDTAEDPGQFDSDYKGSKFEAEKVALRYAKEGLPVVIVNPSTPIGPWDRKPTPTGKVIVDFVNGKIPAYVETGLNFADVRDVCEGHLLAAEKGRVGERYILGGHNLSMVQFLSLLAHTCRELGISGAPAQAPSMRIPYSVAWLTGLVSTAWSDYVSGLEPKVERELGYQIHPIEPALGDAINWFLAEGYFNKQVAQVQTERKAYVSSI